MMLDYNNPKRDAVLGKFTAVMRPIEVAPVTASATTAEGWPSRTGGGGGGEGGLAASGEGVAAQDDEHASHPLTQLRFEVVDLADGPSDESRSSASSGVRTAVKTPNPAV